MLCLGGFCQTRSILHVTSATQASFANGLIGRQVDLTKYGYKCGSVQEPNTTPHQMVDRAVLARNLIPSLSAGTAPLMAMTGRGDAFSALGRTPAYDDLNVDDGNQSGAESASHRNIRNIFQLLTILITRDAKLIVETCGKRQLRSGAHRSYQQGRIADAYLPTRNIWGGG